MIKRIARAAVPLFVAILIAWPFGFPFGLLFLGAVLSYLTYEYWEGAYTAGERVVRAVQGWTQITEVKMPPPEERPVTGQFREEDVPAPFRHDAPTEVLDLEVVAGAPEPPTVEEDPDFTIGKTEDGRVITLDAITSLGVGGVPGSGKTVSMVGLAAQAVVKYQGDIRFLVVDPHMHSGSSDALSARMAPLAPFYLNVENLPNPVSGGADLLKWIKWMTSQAKDRISGIVPREQQLKLVLVADEFTALMDDPEIAEALTALLLLINEQARKVGMFALVASPSWKSSRVQGTDIRNTIATFLVHNMPPAIARMLIPVSEAERSNTLAKGQAIFSSFGQVEIVRVPFMTSAAIIKCVEPYLPPVTGLAVEAEPEAEAPVQDPGIAMVRAIWETYQMLNKDLSYEEDNAIRALAIDFYPGEPRGQEKVRRALKLGEEHL